VSAAGPATGIQYDKEWSCRIGSIYTTPDVADQRRAVLDAFKLRESERVLGVRSGPGLLLRAGNGAWNKVGGTKLEFLYCGT
jgi:hypothetical protein